MLDRPNPYNYLFKHRRIARMVCCEVSGFYEFYDTFGLKIGEVMEDNYDKNFEEISPCFEVDKIPCLNLEDSMPYFEDGRDYNAMVDEFINKGTIQDGLSISMISNY